MVGFGGSVMRESQGVASAAASTTLAEIDREVAAQEALARNPWSLVIVEHPGCADYLRRFHVDAVSPTESCWRDRLPAGPDSAVLLLDRCQRLAGDLAQLGVAACFGAHTPLPYRFPSEYLEERAKVAHDELSDADIAELWRVVTDCAVRVECPATGHPDSLPGPRLPRIRTVEELLAARPPRWLIKGLVPQASVGFIASQPNVGKSTLGIDWAQSIYHGCDWFGHRVLPGNVVIVLGEGFGGIAKRIDAWQREHAAGDTAGRYLRVVTDLPPLAHQNGRDVLGKALETISVACGEVPSLVVIDTLSSLWGGESEDKSEIAGPFMRFLNDSAGRTGTTFLVCHHLSKGPQDKPLQMTLASMRGSGAFGGAADFVVGLEPIAGGARLVTLKQKDHERAAPIDMALHKVVLGMNEDGDEVSGAFFIPAAATAAVRDPDAERRCQDRADTERLLRALRELGETGAIGAVVCQAHMKSRRGYDLFRIALAKGFIVDLGTSKRPRYVVKEGGAPPTPLGEGGKGNPSLPLAFPEVREVREVSRPLLGFPAQPTRARSCP
jgi:hypothetical protein